MAVIAYHLYRYYAALLKQGVILKVICNFYKKLYY